MGIGSDFQKIHDTRPKMKSWWVVTNIISGGLGFVSGFVAAFQLGDWMTQSPHYVHTSSVPRGIWFFLFLLLPFAGGAIGAVIGYVSRQVLIWQKLSLRTVAEYACLGIGVVPVIGFIMMMIFPLGKALTITITAILIGGGVLLIERSEAKRKQLAIRAEPQQKNPHV